MKTIKFLFLLVAFSAATFYSCSDDNSIENQSTAQKSIALRTVLNKLKNEPANRSAVATPATGLCFDFVFPISFSYNNGTAVTATSLEGLIEILQNESPSLHLDGVVFPFQVQTGGAVRTIADEADLIALIIQCGLPTFDDDLQHSYCFDIHFPIQIMNSGQIVTVHSQEELNTYLDNPSGGAEAQIVYPITVIDDNNTVVIHNVFEFYDMVNSCNENDCICTLEYMPVCVNTPNGTIEFSNLCFAQCAGYSQSDFVTCPTSTCSITNLWVQTGACNSDNTYSLTLSFAYDPNPAISTFEVRNSANILVGTYDLASLPITINNYENPANTPDDVLHVNMGPDCSEYVTWTKPICGNNCSITNVSAMVGPCNTAGGYALTVDFDVANSNATQFQVINSGGGVVGTYLIAQLPVTIHTYPMSLTAIPSDYMTIAIGAGCTATKDWIKPNCNPSSTHTFGQLLGSCFNMSYPITVLAQGATHVVTTDGELLQWWNAAQPMPTMVYPITVTFANSVYTFQDEATFQSRIDASCP